MNLMDSIKQQISGVACDKIAQTFGISRETARAGVDAVLPTIMSGLANTASTPEGARRLDAAVEAADDNVMRDVGGATRQAEAAGGQIESLLGGGGIMSAISGAISKFTGVPSSKVNAIIAALAPMVLGFLKGTAGPNQYGADPLGGGA